MAGIIVLKSGDWHISGGGFRAVADGVSKYLPNTAVGSEVKTELSQAVESQLYFIDFIKSFTTEMVDVFKSSLEQHIAEVENQKPETSPNPGLYEGYMERIRELYKLLSD